MKPHWLPTICVAISAFGCATNDDALSKQPFDFFTLQPWVKLERSCGDGTGRFVRAIGHGVVLQLVPLRRQGTTWLNVIFRLGTGHSARLAESTLRITVGGAVPERRMIESFAWDVARRRLPGPAEPPFVEFASTEQLTGMEPSEELLLASYADKATRFVSRVFLAPRVLDTFAVNLPAIEVEGRTIEVPEVLFTYSRNRYHVECTKQ